MSYFPTSKLNSVVPSLRGFASYEGRLAVNRASPTTMTAAPFVVPQLNGSITFNVDSASPGTMGDFLPGDLISVGELFGYFETPASPIDPVTGEIRNLLLNTLGSWNASYVFGTPGLYVIGPAGQKTVTTDTFTLSSFTTRTVPNFEVQTAANVPANSIVKVTSYAGVYEVTAIQKAVIPNTITAELRILGDLQPGDTVTTDASVSQGTLLGVTPADCRMFYPINVLAQVVALDDGGSSNTPAIAVGWGGNEASSYGACQFAQFVDGDTSGGGSLTGATSVSLNEYKFLNMNGNSSTNQPIRRGAPPNMPIFACVNTKSSATTYDLLVAVRGFYI